MNLISSSNVQILTAHGWHFDVTPDVWAIIQQELTHLGADSYTLIEFEDKYGATVQYRARDIVGSRADDEDVMRNYREEHAFDDPS